MLKANLWSENQPEVGLSILANAARVTYPAALQHCKFDAPLLAAGLLTGFGDNAGSGFPSILATWKEEGWVKPELIEDTALNQVMLRWRR